MSEADGIYEFVHDNAILTNFIFRFLIGSNKTFNNANDVIKI